MKEHNFRFLEFTQDNGSKISINPAHLVSLSEYTSDPPACCMYLAGHPNRIMVKGTYAEVKERCLY